MRVTVIAGYAGAVRSSEVGFIAAETPSLPSGETNRAHLESTVPAGCGNLVET